MMHPSQRKAMELKRRGQRQPNLTLVYGPPCAGKTTYVRDNARPDDMVIDYDLIAQEMGSTRTHGHDVPHQLVMTQVERRLAASRQSSHAWLVKCDPTRSDLNRAAAHVLIDPGMDVCLDRAATERPEGWVDLIRGWYARYQGL